MRTRKVRQDGVPPGSLRFAQAGIPLSHFLTLAELTTKIRAETEENSVTRDLIESFAPTELVGAVSWGV
jgi:hypothetical protein